MDVLEAIATRRSVGRVLPERPPRELVERVLEAAVHGPNHFLTQSWRFFVVAGGDRELLGRAMARALKTRQPEPDAPAAASLVEREAAKPLRAPVLIVVALEPASDPRALEVEEIEAGAAAVENLLLAAHALGLGAQWRTGDAAYYPETKEFFGLSPRAHVLAFVYLGYPDGSGRPTLRQPATGHTTWLGWD